MKKKAVVNVEERKIIEDAIRAHKPVQYRRKNSNGDWEDLKSLAIINWDFFDYQLKPKEVKAKKEKTAAVAQKTGQAAEMGAGNGSQQ